MRKSYPRRIKYKTGQRYFSYTILESVQPKETKSGKMYSCWKCLCDCGIEFITTTKQIKKGIRKSCGCLSKSNRFKKINPKDVVINARLNHYISGAKRRDLTFELSRNEFAQLLFGDCVYCGSKPSLKYKHKRSDFLVNGIDRINSNLGYIKDNCVSCCSYCNFAKSNKTLQQFEDWINRLVKFRTKNEYCNY